jgi:hypothetical protein
MSQEVSGNRLRLCLEEMKIKKFKLISIIRISERFDE